MIVFIYGTTAEAIKLAPIARRLDALGVPYEQWVTFQHTDALRAVLPTLGLPPVNRVIADGRNGAPLRSSADVIPWLMEAGRWLLRHRRSLKKSTPPNSIVIVHGDTLTTVVGAFIAKRLAIPSAHVEAGLRSGNWRHPFPEELNRRIVGRWAAIHYAPALDAVENLAGRQNVVFTHGNTAIDEIADKGMKVAAGDDYAVVLLHRFEFMSNKALVVDTVQTIVANTPVPVRFFVDEFVRATMEAIGRDLPADRISFESKLPHDDFIDVLAGAQYIVTDSGGIQEEAAFLGIPTLVHRKATERSDGLTENVRLSGWDLGELEGFLSNYESLRISRNGSRVSPSQVIVDDLVARGYAVAAPVA